MKINNSYYELENNEKNNLTSSNLLINLYQNDQGLYFFNELKPFDFKIVKFNDGAFYGNINDYLCFSGATFDYFSNKIVESIEIDVVEQDNYFYCSRIPIINNTVKNNQLKIKSVVGSFDVNKQLFKGVIGY